MDKSEISISEALNQLQSWFNAGEYDKVIQGTQEVLELEPGNQRALSLMKKAGEKRYENIKTSPASAPLSSSPFDPLAELQVEEQENVQDEKAEKRKLFLAMLIPALVVVLLGGVSIWWLANREREAIIADNSNLPIERSYLEENEKRLNDLSLLAGALEEYKFREGAYPSTTQLEAAILDSDEFDEIPSDPRQGELDKAGKPFGYIYAIYEGIGGENSVYILSGLFEDSKGFAYAWSKGAPIKNYPDYRSYEEKNITFIGGDEEAVAALEQASNSKTDPNDSSSSTGPKVNPENQ